MDYNTLLFGTGRFSHGTRRLREKVSYNRGQYKGLDLTFDPQVAVCSGVKRVRTACGTNTEELDEKRVPRADISSKIITIRSKSNP
jgi:hypothetical protein